MSQSLLILGVQSPLCVEFEETCYRSSIEVEAAISFGTIVRWLDSSVVVIAADFDVSSAASSFLPCAFAPARRRELVEWGDTQGLPRAEALLDPSSIVAKSARISQLVFINSAAVIGAATIIRTGAFINRSSSVGHHCIVGAYTSIGPGAVLASNVVLGDDSIVGAGAVVCPDIRIGSGAVISAGATVSQHVPDGALVRAPKSKILLNASRRTKLIRGTDE